MGYDPKILLANQFAEFFTFDLFDLLNLIPGVHCYIVLFLCVFLICFLVFFVFDIARFIKPFTNYFNFFSPRHASVQSVFCGERIGEMLQLNISCYYI